MSAAEELRRQPNASLGEQVRRALRARIAEGRLHPGDRLFEQDLAAEFGISRVPVREAIRRLQGDGLVEVRDRRRGVFVRGLDRRQAEELFDVREALEVLAARLAAERGSEAGVARTAALTASARRSLEAGDLAAMAEANAAFHDELVALSGHELLANVLEPLHGRLAYLFRLNLEPERVCTEHEQLHAAIAAGDAERAAALACRHVRSSRRMVFAHDLC
ncbi:GntR family transcriptional regulator [Saccharopolyspora cebuensis]|uniref:GntR family transcriptional regulator n=1 Tax=Saccharopolyspora cebuensis TaxID=418759 RepID=A0ABV4CC97_9PSEU